MFNRLVCTAIIAVLSATVLFSQRKTLLSDVLVLCCVCCVRLKKTVEYWKEQAGLLTAEAKAAADLSDIDNRRCDSPAISTADGDFAAVPGSSASSVCGSRPSNAACKGMAAAAALQAAAAANAAPAIGGDDTPDSRSSCGDGPEVI